MRPVSHRHGKVGGHPGAGHGFTPPHLARRMSILLENGRMHVGTAPDGLEDNLMQHPPARDIMRGFDKTGERAQTSPRETLEVGR